MKILWRQQVGIFSLGLNNSQGLRAALALVSPMSAELWLLCPAPQTLRKHIPSPVNKGNDEGKGPIEQQTRLYLVVKPKRRERWCRSMTGDFAGLHPAELGELAEVLNKWQYDVCIYNITSGLPLWLCLSGAGQWELQWFLVSLSFLWVQEP